MCKIWRRWYKFLGANYEISESSIGLYFQIKENLKLYIEKDGKMLGRVEKTLLIILHQKPKIRSYLAHQKPQYLNNI